MVNPTSRYSASTKCAIVFGSFALITGLALLALSRFPMRKHLPLNPLTVGPGTAGAGLLLIALLVIFGRKTEQSLPQKPNRSTSTAKSEAGAGAAADIGPTESLPAKIFPKFEGDTRQETENIFESWNCNRNSCMDMERISRLNHAIMADVGGETPNDYIWAYKGCPVNQPMPILDDHHMELEEGQFYELESWENAPLKLINGDLEDIFGCAFKRVGNKLELYFDSISQGLTLMINGIRYPYLYGCGANRPSMILKEGDIVVSSAIPLAFCFKVGPNATILYSNPEKPIPQHVASTEYYNTLQRTHRADLVAPIPNGFVDSATADQTNRDQDFVIVDLDRDVVLRKLVNYLQREFEKYGYSDKEKHMRLTLFVTDLLAQDIESWNIKDQFLLGEFVRGGRGVCRHRSLLYKVLADQLGLQATLVSAYVPVRRCFNNGPFSGHTIPNTLSGGHAWIETSIDGKEWIIDPMQGQAFPKENPPLHNCGAAPGANPQGHPWLSFYYGMRSLNEQ
ncbi:MAG: hypothetical protein S4CHLAM81_00260 [Chlamydiales bacterium]|nr:hypothetical protein [Chlamydiales bacterium]MCH9634828.1 hypothetical protein [Chlamydiales bacterium]MCH9703784.1 transglutaminase family protein [Chlamydiota bacterium]